MNLKHDIESFHFDDKVILTYETSFLFMRINIKPSYPRRATCSRYSDFRALFIYVNCP